MDRQLGNKKNAGLTTMPLKRSTGLQPELAGTSVPAAASCVGGFMHASPELADIFGVTTPEAVDKPLSERSTDELIVQIEAGRFPAEVARLWGVAASNLNKWIAADANRLMRARIARENQAALWDWVALQVLLRAPSERTEILRAEKIAQHCRWRAGIFNRRDYGQNIKVTQADERNVRELTTGELHIIAQGGIRPD